MISALVPGDQVSGWGMFATHGVVWWLRCRQLYWSATDDAGCCALHDKLLGLARHTVLGPQDPEGLHFASQVMYVLASPTADTHVL